MKSHSEMYLMFVVRIQSCILDEWKNAFCRENRERIGYLTKLTVMLSIFQTVLVFKPTNLE